MPEIGSLYYAAHDALLTATEGATIEADLRAVSSDSGANKGGSMELCEGSNQYVLWLRADGLNIHGQAHVAIDLSDRKHRIKLKAANGVCRVYVDEQLRQYGEAVNATARREAAWGSGPGAA